MNSLDELLQQMHNCRMMFWEDVETIHNRVESAENFNLLILEIGKVLERITDKLQVMREIETGMLYHSDKSKELRDELRDE